MFSDGLKWVNRLTLRSRTIDQFAIGIKMIEGLNEVEDFLIRALSRLARDGLKVFIDRLESDALGKTIEDRPLRIVEVIENVEI